MSRAPELAALQRDDWQALFRAVTERLQREVENLSWAGDDPARGGVNRLEALRECVGALQLLRREGDALPAEAPVGLRAGPDALRRVSGG